MVGTGSIHVDAAHIELTAQQVHGSAGEVADLAQRVGAALGAVARSATGSAVQQAGEEAAHTWLVGLSELARSGEVLGRATLVSAQAYQELETRQTQRFDGGERR